MTWLLALAMIVMAPVAHAVNYELTLPDGEAGHIRVDPGQTGSFTFDIRNLDAQPGTAIGSMDLTFPTGELGFSGSGQPSACGAPTSSYLTPSTVRLHFPVTLDGAAQVRCTYPVMRAASSVNDTRLALCTGRNSSTSTSCLGTVKFLVAGSLPDIAMQVSPVVDLPFGSIETVFRVTVSNHSATGTRPFSLATDCRPMSADRPYTLHGDFEGACPRVSYNPGCVYDFGFGVPIPIENWLVEVPSMPAEGTTSCLVKMRFTAPLASAVVGALGLRRPQHDPFPPIPLLPGPANRGRDVNAANDGGMLFGAVPFVATPVPASGRMALVGLIVLIAVMAARGYRRRRSRC